MGVAAPARRQADDYAERQTASALHITPAPEAVAGLIASHGVDVAQARWSWIGTRTLAALARVGRVRLGWEAAPNNGRTRSTPQAGGLTLKGRHRCRDLRPGPPPGPRAGLTHEERIAALEEEACRLRETNTSLLGVLSSPLLEVRAFRVRSPKPVAAEVSDA
ncbi:MAG: hypothetical protein MIL41_05040 [Hyphomicrobiales bacterium]|jgi:hypothetical protein